MNIYKKGKLKHVYIHRLVAEAFISNPKNKRCINHIDGNKSNNKFENLEFCTHSENIKHAYKTGLNKRKRKVVQYDIHGNYMRTWDSLAQIKKELGISCGNIVSVCKNKRKTAGNYIWKYKEA